VTTYEAPKENKKKNLRFYKTRPVYKIKTQKISKTECKETKKTLQFYSNVTQKTKENIHAS